MWRTQVFNYVFVGSLAAIVFSAVYALFDLPYRWAVATAAVAPALFVTARIVEAQGFVDVKLDQMITGGIGSLSVYSRTLPKYRYYDLYRAAARFAEKRGLTALETTHASSLDVLLNRAFLSDQERPLKKPPSVSLAIGPGEQGFVPSEGFWASVGADQRGVVILRVRTEPYTANAILEVASHGAYDPADDIERIVSDCAAQSIYKGRLVELQFQKQSVDDFDGVVQGHAMDLHFLAKTRVSDEDIVLPEETRQLLHRVVLDFHANRQQLKALGLDGKRGLLFYGPPGTGKTFTTKYLASHLEGITTLVVSGNSLSHVRAVCNAARLLQPSLVVMEDVDLVFQSRDTNFGGATLGDLMDELDGFSGDDDILYVLTTNAIERVEAAIKDRPGRISQCLYFGAPTHELRKRYLELLLEPYAASTVNLDAVARATDGCTQAFLKELVYRAVQIAWSRTKDGENVEPAPGMLPLKDEDFTVATTEMRSGAGRAGEAIIGFRLN